jgi:hypothetical protein
MQTDDVITMRKPNSGFFLLDSADRNLTGASSSLSPETQPWNDFRIVKPQPLLDGFAKNIGVTEVFFPWCIPNVNTYNNTLYMTFATGGIQTVTVPTGFYTGSTLAAALQVALNGLIGIGGPAPTVSYNSATRTFTMVVQGGNTFELYNRNADAIDLNYFVKNPSLLKTLGFNAAQLGSTVNTSITGSTTFIRYTDYIDIVSNRLHYDNEIKDGDSSQKTTRDVLCRLYLANEVSTYSVDEVGTAPFIIHRQFMSPKFIRLNPQQFFNSIDIQVLDQYGNLAYIPPSNPVPALSTIIYPDFKLTFMSSEQ